ncbi:hypothetical protein CANTEDRAFT_112742 [Yamadazyma tenuis ATCC 10573]|uniref:Alcohol acetyltransferase n=2 Tax=Candida tenuis (strain ATCC 10573 / BCRC 21748 / CBS 615 / JCM 9827 / NBRC 10315 / NRRL Y-1498 / VKM Y-70) TaxID=590646 RepID=G3AYL0_CANTC|nr:uncharacterized protein CANTEDRAFT_112742 [Yamadazyma tenuis ATCC 10573]EGV66218.1 hypothetical protein CANTEDRAFT_112742 [Yamadazyma tenuis ATCC 10573]
MINSIVIQRPLSVYENFFRCRTANRFYKTFQVASTYSKPLTRDNLAAALRRFLLDYHLFACNVFLEEGGYVMKPIDRVMFDDVFVDRSQDSETFLHKGVITEAAMTWLNHYQFDLYVQKPLFKVVLFDPYTLSVVLDHTLFDGVTASSFHEVFLKILDDLDADAALGCNNNDVLFSKEEDTPHLTHSLPPPIDDYLPSWDLDYSDGDPNYYDKVTPPGLKKFPGRFPNSTNHTLAFKLTNFPPSELRMMLARSKQEGVTLTAYLQYVLVMSFQPVFGDTYYTVNKVAIALRRYFSKDKAPPHYKHYFDDLEYKNMGVSANLGLAQNYPPLKKFSWDDVKKASGNLAAAVKNEKLLNMSVKFRDSYNPLTDNEGFFTGIGGNKSETSKLSNLGFIKIPEYKHGWTISNMIFSQDVSAVTSDFMFNFISTPEGGLNIVTSYYNHSFEDCEVDNFDSFLENFRSNALKYCQL